MGNPIVYRLGERALVLDPAPSLPIDIEKQRKLCWLATQCRAAKEVESAIPGMNNLTLICKSSATVNYWLQHLANLWQQAETESLSTNHHVIEVKYGGQYGIDLDAVARLHQLSTQEVIEIHSAANYQVCFLGFMPGFAYLTGLDSRIMTPRLATPRSKVPAGSVAIGGEQTGIYPSDSPGGWQIIGHSDVTLFDPNAASPSLLQPGDTLSFTAIKHSSGSIHAAN
ncbi:5-oxoprolinase subunit PxpB [Shewanella waksmanii]|uniref:5-oxoprolinase subunit PxpB n=1 Tax=Shewanella waksmanii TaxID=213783 RepID=UPI003736E87B